MSIEKDKKKPLPEGWRRVRLGDHISDSQAGFASGKRDSRGVIQLRMNNVTTDGTLNWNDYIRVPCNESDVKRYSLGCDDVVFNNTNSTELVGKSAIFLGFSEPVVYSNHFTRIRSNPSSLLPAFLAYWLNHQWRKGIFSELCNRWIGQSAVKADMLFRLEMPLPPLEVQQRIINQLEKKKEKIARARAAAQARLEAIRALPVAYLREVFPDRGEELPEGWKWARLGDQISDSQAGFSSGERDSRGVIQLRMNNVTTDGALNWTDYIRVPCCESDAGRYSLKCDDVIFNNTNSTELVGKSAIFQGYNEPVVYSNHFTRIRTNPTTLLPAFLAYWLNHQWQKGVFAELCNRWIGQSAVKTNMLFRLEIPLPPLKVQQKNVYKFDKLKENTTQARTAAEAELAAIEALPAAILRKAFNGEL